MLFRLLIAFILIPFVELVLLLQMADATDWLTTLTIVVVTGILGSVLARREGIAAFMRFRAAMAEGRVPGREIQDGMMIAFAAALLLTPGLLTDAFGFLLLTPWGRHTIGGFLRRRYGGRFQMHTSGSGGGGESGGSSTIDPTQPNPRRGSGDGNTVDSPSFRTKSTSAFRG